jgi:hypothetical protein
VLTRHDPAFSSPPEDMFYLEGRPKRNPRHALPSGIHFAVAPMSRMRQPAKALLGFGGRAGGGCANHTSSFAAVACVRRSTNPTSRAEAQIFQNMAAAARSHPPSSIAGACSRPAAGALVEHLALGDDQADRRQSSSMLYTIICPSVIDVTREQGKPLPERPRHSRTAFHELEFMVERSSICVAHCVRHTRVGSQSWSRSITPGR